MDPGEPPDVTSITNELDGATQLAFSVSLRLANLHRDVDDDVARHLEDSIDLLDDLVRRLRHVAFELIVTQARTAPPDDPVIVLAAAGGSLHPAPRPRPDRPGNAQFVRRAAAALDTPKLH